MHPNQALYKNKNDKDEDDRLYALRDSSDSLSYFGSGADFRIYVPSSKYKSYSNLGFTYKLPEGKNHE